jgi:hypothetical protein
MKTYQQLTLEELTELKEELDYALFIRSQKEWVEEIKEHYGPTVKTIQLYFESEYNDNGGSYELLSSFSVYDKDGTELDVQLEDPTEDDDDFISEIIEELKDSFSGDGTYSEFDIDATELPEVYKKVEL